jgi:hypothetical protein
VSANDIAEYLMEVSREMASEVKSEIREMVNAVDVLISPDVQSHEEKSSCAESPVDTPGSYPGIAACLNTKLGDLSGERTQSSECSSDETVIHTLSVERKAGQAPANGTRATETEEEAEDVTAGSKQCCQMRSTINSISSQDSGINLTFQESDSSSHGTSEGTGSELASGHVCKINNLSDSSTSSIGCGAKLGISEHQLVSVPSDCASGACLISQEALEARAQQDISDTIKPACKVTRWHCPPKSIWKPSVEVHFFFKFNVVFTVYLNINIQFFNQQMHI